MGWQEDHIKERIVPKLPDVTDLPEIAYLTFFAGLHAAYTEPEYNPRDEDIIPFFTQIAHILLKHATRHSPLQTTLRSFFADVPYGFATATILGMPVPYQIENERRYSHAWLCAHSEAGKTTLLKNLIAQDLEDVKARKASVVVIDSQGRNELIGQIEKWGILDELDYKLIDTTVPMNPFVMGRDRAISPREREILQTNAIDTISYVFSSALGDGGNFTAKQRTLFDNCVQLLLTFPSTIVDLLALMQSKGLDRYRVHIPKLSPPAQVFFNTSFDTKTYMDTKTEISWRLDGILKNPAFARMFTTRDSFDFYRELGKPQLLLVDTDKALLGGQGTEIFGRYVIAQILSAIQQRANTTYRLPTYVYIDEAHDYIANDENIATIIDQARKMRVGFTFSHQRETQIRNGNVLDALRHCAIQFKPIEDEKRRYHFDLTVRGKTPVDVYSPLVDRPRRAPPKQYPRLTVAPPLEGEIVPPNRPTSQDNRALPFPKKWDKDEME